MTSNPKVSIVVPVYNSSEYLNDLYDSLAMQSFGDFEIVFVNDGSTDNSLDILGQLQERDSRVRVYSQDNGGGARARNKGISEARGELLICVDSDDFFDSKFIEKMARPFDVPDVDMTFCDIDAYYESSQEYSAMPWAVRDVPSNTPFSPLEIPNLYYEIMGYIGNKMFRRSLITENGLSFQEIRSHDDLSIVYLAISSSRKIQYVDEVLYHYRRRQDETSVTDTTMTEMYDCAFLALYDLRQNLIRLGLWESYRSIFVNYALYFCKWKYDSVPDDVKQAVRVDLRDEWFRKLDVLGYPREMYIRDVDYEFISTILFYELNKVKDAKLAKSQKRVKKLLDENKKLKEDSVKSGNTKASKIGKRLSKFINSR